MKDLLNISGTSIVVALNDRAYAILDCNSEKKQLVELLPSTSQSGQKTGKTSQPNSIQAVSCRWNEHKQVLLCAVSRQDKHVSVYSLSLNNVETSQVEPIVIHKTNKRSCSLAFAEIPFEDKCKGSLDILVTADLAGDVQAFPTDALQPKAHRLLLGHTASMLTAMKISNGKIFTADRDEKIRISSFPSTFEVEGYLLGHREYVTDMDLFGEDHKYCVSSSGDCSIRLWDTDKCIELANINVSPQEDEEITSDDENPANGNLMQIPVRLDVSKKNGNLAVIYHGKSCVDLFSLSSNGTSVQKLQSIECVNPLAIAFNSNDEVCVLTKEPYFFARFAKNVDGVYAELKGCEISRAIREKGGQNQAIMPTSVMEVDEVTGRFKLMKNIHDERETYVEHKPWLRGKERIQKLKDKERRRKRKKRENEGGDVEK